MLIKFREVPKGGRILLNNEVWVVIERHGRGLVAREALTPGHLQSLCCFVDVDAGITQDTLVNFIALNPHPAGA